ncbi:hypothetical protein AJ80_08217 [Polytolypa hystricis UAMH7299]|uniref:HNH nuclease domain-containing protein n=1 Tax=Polytolypa hystricis (strain UAMH7299) TaxID=1447883 RepID=A0A2B7XBG5_POLH7|nr:hypothetical protein AJ80_08217 [Polytolypa hystricis UAMH7299]
MLRETRSAAPNVPLPRLFIFIVDRLNPTNFTVSGPRIPVLPIIRALMIHSPDPLAIAHRLVEDLNHRSLGNTITAANLTSGALNRPDNGILLESAAHAAFDSYRNGIECDNDEYHLIFIDDCFPPPLSLHGRNGRTLPFGSWQRRNANPNVPLEPLPNKSYLRMHLALARVLHASGADEIIDKILQDEEDMKAESGCLLMDYGSLELD